MVRLADIAKRAGVSQGTVSAVLSGGTKGNIRVSPEKRERILAIAKEMKYIPNFSAQKLSGQSSHTIGVLVDPTTSGMGDSERALRYTCPKDSECDLTKGGE